MSLVQLLEHRLQASGRLPTNITMQLLEVLRAVAIMAEREECYDDPVDQQHEVDKILEAYNRLKEHLNG